MIKQKNERKAQLGKNFGRREMGRSMKPPLNNQIEVKPVVDEYEVNMLKFLGITFTPEVRAAAAALDHIGKTAE